MPLTWGGRGGAGASPAPPMGPPPGLHGVSSHYDALAPRHPTNKKRRKGYGDALPVSAVDDRPDHVVAMPRRRSEGEHLDVGSTSRAGIRDGSSPTGGRHRVKPVDVGIGAGGIDGKPHVWLGNAGKVARIAHLEFSEVERLRRSAGVGRLGATVRVRVDR